MDQHEKKVKQTTADQGQQQGEILILRAMGAAMDGEGRVAGSKLIQTMMRLDPAFDVRSTGHSTFTKYLEASPEVKVTRRRGANDVTVELADLSSSAAPARSAKQEKPAVEEQKASGTWWPGVDAAWNKRAAKSGDAIPGPTAASYAAEVLGVSKLSASPYKTLQRLLEASDELRARWSRDRNTIIRQ